jgi:hypothetical protein
MSWQYAEKVGIRFILPGLVILMLLVSLASAQSVRENAPQDLLPQHPYLEEPVRLSDRPSVAGEPTLGFSTNLVAEPSVSHWWRTSSQSPFPHASAFALQTNLSKFLDTWPAPGTTVARDEPPDGELTDDDLM